MDPVRCSAASRPCRALFSVLGNQVPRELRRQEELVFAEDTGSNGSGERQQIVYRSAVAVTPDALDALCDKARPTWQRACCV
jgi:hypothetical protein